MLITISPPPLHTHDHKHKCAHRVDTLDELGDRQLVILAELVKKGEGMVLRHHPALLGGGSGGHGAAS